MVASAPFKSGVPNGCQQQVLVGLPHAVDHRACERLWLLMRQAAPDCCCQPGEQGISQEREIDLSPIADLYHPRQTRLYSLGLAYPWLTDVYLVLRLRFGLPPREVRQVGAVLAQRGRECIS